MRAVLPILAFLLLGAAPGRAENVFASEPAAETLCYDVLFAGLPAAGLTIGWQDGAVPHIRVKIDTVGLVELFSSYHFDAVTRFARKPAGLVPTEHRIDIRKPDKHSWSDLTYDGKGRLKHKYTHEDAAKKREGRVEKDVRDGIDSGLLMMWLLAKARAMRHGDDDPVRHVYHDGWDPIEVRLLPKGRGRENHAGHTVPVLRLEMWTKSIGDTKPGSHRPEGDAVQLYFEDSDNPKMLWATFPLPIFNVWVELDRIRPAGESCDGE